jgi:hypothetical protein
VTVKIKCFRATSCVKWLNGEKTSVSRTISVLVLRVLKWFQFPSVSYIYLPEPRVHGCVLALRMRMEMVLEMLVFSPFNHLTWLVAREDFIIHVI